MSRQRASLIFQRCAQAFRAQDWAAAAIELVLVVVGVFLGFQLNNWNEGRKDRNREVSYMLNVAQDLRNDVGEMDEIARTAASRMAALDALLARTGDWDPPPSFPSSRYAIVVEHVPQFSEDSGNTIGIESFILSTLDGSRFAYDTLINADGLGVISDQALLREIQEYYVAVDKVRHFEESLEENRVGLINAMSDAGLSAVSGAALDDVAQALKGRPALRAATENYWLYANRHVFLTGELMREAETLAVSIEDRYGS